MQPKPSKYRITVEQVMPASAESSLFSHPKCVLGVSMSNPIFWRSSLDKILEWMALHFDTSMILVGDYLHRFNEQIVRGGTEEMAAERALEVGDDFMEQLEQYLPKYPAGKFEVMRWQPFHQEPAFWEAKEQMHGLYASNPEVKASIDSAASLFVWQKQDRSRFKVTKSTAVELSAQYLLEEMAVFSMLIEKGWEVVIYPGAQLPLLMEIAKGRFKDIPNSLDKGVYVELKVRKK